MDKNRFSVYWETVRFLFGLAILYYFGDWFGLNSLFLEGNFIVVSYLLLSLVMTVYFLSFEFKAKNVALLNA
jgi:hypothetical protein